MNKTIISFFLLFFSAAANCQVEKRTWLFGGNATFSSVKSSSTIGENKRDVIEVDGNAGYFFMDKLTAGLRPKFGWSKSQEGPSLTAYIIGPFIRYYFLPIDSRVNLFTEGNYAYGLSKSESRKAISNKYAFLAGPVLFLNSAVGLELSFGYSIQKLGKSGGRTKTFQTGLGFQFHLTN